MKEQPTGANEHWRSFIAIPVAPAPAKQLLVEAQGRIQEPVRWHPPANLHLTLAFLDRQPPATLKALANALAGSTLPAPFSLASEALTPFPQTRGPYWALTLRATTPLLTLWQQMRGLVADRGLTLDDRPLRPHVTLGKIPRQPQAATGAAMTAPQALDWTLPVRSVALWHSALSEEGPRYRIIAERALGTGNG